MKQTELLAADLGVKPAVPTYPTLCQSCASDNHRAKLHGAPDKNYCQACGKVHHSYDLATYRIASKREVTA